MFILCLERMVLHIKSVHACIFLCKGYCNGLYFNLFLSSQVPFQCLWWSMCVAPIGWESRVITRPMPRRTLRYKALLLKDYLPSLSLTNPPDKALLLGVLTGIGSLRFTSYQFGGQCENSLFFSWSIFEKKKTFWVNKTHTAQGWTKQSGQSMDDGARDCLL